MPWKPSSTICSPRSGDIENWWRHTKSTTTQDVLGTSYAVKGPKMAAMTSDGNQFYKIRHVKCKNVRDLGIIPSAYPDYNLWLFICTRSSKKVKKLLYARTKIQPCAEPWNSPCNCCGWVLSLKDPKEKNPISFAEPAIPLPSQQG